MAAFRKLGSGILRGFRTFGLILWKNLLLRKRQWVVSGHHFRSGAAPHFYPAYFAIPSRSSKTEYKPVQYFEKAEVDPSSFRWKFCRDHIVAYSPPSAKSFMESEVGASLCDPGADNQLTLKPMRNSDELEKAYDKTWANDKNFKAAVIFPDGLKIKDNQIRYTIRMPPQCLPSTEHLYPAPEHKGLYFKVGPNTNNIKTYSHPRNCESFLGLQWYLDAAIMKSQGIRRGKSTVSLQPMPYPEHPDHNSLKNSGKGLQLVMIVMVLAFASMFMLPSVTRNVLSEKRAGMAELLRLTGVPIWLQWFGWFVHINIILPQMLHVFLLTLLLTLVVDDEYGAPFLPHSNGLVVFICLMLFLCATISMGFLFCSVFRKPIMATALVLMFNFIGIIIGTFLLNLENEAVRTIPATILPNLAILVTFFNVMSLEGQEVDDSDEPYGLTWSTLTVEADGGSIGGQPTIAYLGILFLQFSVFLLVAAYLDAVLPSEFGVRRPWYLFTCFAGRERSVTTVHPTPPPPPETSESQAMTEKSEDTTTAPSEMTVVRLSSPFEPDPVGAAVGVEVVNMVKQFGRDKVAVKGVSLKMFSGDIFALLGHNGAGKTTLISMLTGFFAPTSGTGVINGYDLQRDREKARDSMGFCPQHNMIFEKLTTIEQVHLVGMLRGLKWKAAKAEGLSLLARMNLSDKASVLASKLSGGQKRKLQLAMALIGGTKVIILDEPTSGMDPQARREIWDLLLKLRGERTILLTTHFMEEADVLGDRIGIMAGGIMQCCGTSSVGFGFFLKKFYGTGYTLKLTLIGAQQSKSAMSSHPESDVSMQSSSPFEHNSKATAILSAVQKIVPNASFKVEGHVDRNELFLSLPSDTATTAVLRQLFNTLTSQKEKLSINTIGLSQTTMDEVFVRVGELSEGTSHAAPVQDEEFLQKSPKVQRNKFLVQFVALLMKKLLYARHRWMSLLMSILLLFFLFLTMIHVATHVLAAPYMEKGPYDDANNRREESQEPSSHRDLPLNFEPYSDPKTLYSGPDDSFTTVIGPSAEKVNNIPEELLKVAQDGREGRISFKKNYIAALEVNNVEIRALFNLHPYHAAPVALNLATNYLLHEKNSPFRITASNHPFNGQSKDMKRSAYDDKPNESEYARSVAVQDGRRPGRKGNRGLVRYIYYLVPGTLPLGLILFLTYFVTQPTEEKICQVKQLQTMTGVSPLVYWGTTFLCDWGLHAVLVLVMTVWMIIVEEAFGYFTILTANGGWFVFLAVCLPYGSAAIMLSYLISLRSSSVAGGYSLFVFIQLLGFFCAMIIGDGLIFGSTDWVKVVMYFFYGFFRLNPAYSMVRAVQVWALVSVRNVASSAIEPLDYWVWSYNPPQSQANDADAVDLPGLIQDIFFLVLWTLVYAGWLLFIEYRIWYRLMKKRGPMNLGDFPPNVTDQDVWEEGARVEELLATRQVNTEALVVHQLSKSFGGFAAVSNLQFAVHPGECFGMLGVNGAGKTTAFRMITGDETPSKGNVYGFNTSLDGDMVRFLSNIGYCPQFDAIITDFTGCQMLQLFGGLRGIPRSNQKAEALMWLQRMGLSDSANVKCGRYSGGMKRRLSTAMAMIGDPALVLLDEPTSGVDPVARRQFWKILEKLGESGQSFILTSHSMEECEALCPRLGIMVNGQFQCFGGVQHLKAKFAQGYSLTLKLKQDLPFGDPVLTEAINMLLQHIHEKMQPCEVKDQHQNMIQIHLQNSNITWDVLFDTMEGIKEEFPLLIEDYSVNETSLEEVFLAFARMQYPERKKEMTACLRCLSCRC